MTEDLIEVKKTQPRDKSGKFTSTGEPPLVSVSVTNPITYFKLWWQKIIGNEGIDLRIRIKPLTAVFITSILALGGIGLGKFTLSARNPIVQYVPMLAPTITPNPYKDTALTGVLRMTPGNKFYLEKNDSTIVSLLAPSSVSLSKYVGKRILATGKLNTLTGILSVSEASDLELLPISITSIPTITGSMSQ